MSLVLPEAQFFAGIGRSWPSGYAFSDGPLVQCFENETWVRLQVRCSAMGADATDHEAGGAARCATPMMGSMLTPAAPIWRGVGPAGVGTSVARKVV